MEGIHLFSDHKIYQHIKIRTEAYSKKDFEKLHELALNYRIEPNFQSVLTQYGGCVEIEIKGFFDSIKELEEFIEKLPTFN